MAAPQAAATEDSLETETIEAFCQFLEKHYGTVLKAWRFNLDPSGDGELFYPEFIEALAVMPPLQCDTTVLWTALMRRAALHDTDAVLRLRELSEDDHHCLKKFKKWADERFGGAIALMKYATQGKPNAAMTFAEFLNACTSFEYQGDASKIFYGCLCQEASDIVSLRDMAYLESDAVKRKGAMDPSFIMMQNAAKSAARKQRNRRNRLRQAKDTALQAFLKKIRKVSGGSLIRGWRRILDQSGNLSVSKTELLKGCKKIAFDGDVVALWRCMDADDDGIVMLEEVDPTLALVMARFKKWAIAVNGGCVATLVQLAAMTRRKTPKWTADDFAVALRLADFSGTREASQKQIAHMLYEAFDIDNQGFFVAQDLAFLDKWNPTPWLIADPNIEGKENFLALLRARYPNLIVAWRKVLDRDNSNRVSYKEFKDACRVLRIRDVEVPGLWRALDYDAGGFISMNEIDQEAADRLMRFKQWAEATFGTIQRMFYVFDRNRCNKVSFPLFRRALRNFGFQDDAAVLFQALKPDASEKKKGYQRELLLDDLLYLSTWECEISKETSQSEDEGGEESPKAPSSPQSSPTGARARQALGREKYQQEGSSMIVEASQDAHLHGLPPVAKSPSKQKAKSRRNVDAMTYCRTIEEYKAFAKSRAHRKPERAESLVNVYLPRVSQNGSGNAAPSPAKKGLDRRQDGGARSELPRITHLPGVEALEHLESLGVVPKGSAIASIRERNLGYSASLPVL